MNRRLAQLCATFALSFVALIALVAAGPAQVWSHADAGGQWVIRRVAETRSTPERWAIYGRKPEGGPLYERVSVGRAPAQVAGYGERLAVLFDDGRWSLASAAGVVGGPSLPEGMRPIAVASREGTLTFLAEPPAPTTAPAATLPTTRVATPKLFRFDGSTFADDGATPVAPAGTVETRLLVGRDLVVIGRRDAESVRLAARHHGTWAAPGAAIPADAFWFANDSRHGPSLIVRHGLDWSIRPIDRAGVAGAPMPVPAGPIVQRRDVAASLVNGELRLAWADDKDIVEQAFDERGAPVGKERRTPPGGATGASATTFDRAMTILSVAAVVLVLLTTGRRGKEQEETAERADAPVPAPLATRAVAGLIDAFPLCVASAIVAAIAPHTEAGTVSLSGAREQLILAAGVATYIVVAFTCERIWGRTPGKALFGLRVVTLAGGPPTTVALLIRNGLRILDLNLVLLLLVPLTALRQRLGDLLAGTIVIDERAAKAAKGGRKSPADPADKPD